jgi:hypothetical protein
VTIHLICHVCTGAVRFPHFCCSPACTAC